MIPIIQNRESIEVTFKREHVSSDHEGGYGKYEGFDREEYSCECTGVYMDGLKPLNHNVYDSPAVTAISGKTDTIFVLWAKYTSGGTFGSSSGHQQLIGLFSDENQARKFGSDIESAAADSKKQVINSNILAKYSIYPSWIGYFERLDRMCVDEVKFYFKKEPNDILKDLIK